jgi:hypothetical protein
MRRLVYQTKKASEEVFLGISILAHHDAGRYNYSEDGLSGGMTILKRILSQSH